MNSSLAHGGGRSHEAGKQLGECQRLRGSYSAPVPALSVEAISMAKQLVSAREANYRFLARLFDHEADGALVEKIAEMPIVAMGSLGSNDSLMEGCKLVVAYAADACKTGIESAVGDLAVDYARTFLSRGIDGHAAAYPYESVYTSGRRLLMQDSFRAVRDDYRRSGIKKSGGRVEPEDFVAFELQYMALLSSRCLSSLEVSANGHDEQTDEAKEALSIVKQQRMFLCKHLLNWIEGFQADIERFAKTSFYRGAGKMLVGFAHLDLQLLDELEEVMDKEQVTQISNHI